MTFLTKLLCWGQSHLQTQTGERLSAKLDTVLYITRNYFGDLNMTQGNGDAREAVKHWA